MSSESMKMQSLLALAGAVSLGSALTASAIAVAAAAATWQLLQASRDNAGHQGKCCKGRASSEGNQQFGHGEAKSTSDQGRSWAYRQLRMWFSANVDTDGEDKVEGKAPRSGSSSTNTARRQVASHLENEEKRKAESAENVTDVSRNLGPAFDDTSRETLRCETASPKAEPWEVLQSPILKNGKPDPFNPTKRADYLSWDDYFMSVAFLSAQRSKDPNRQVGACIVGQDMVILGIGYNGFPRGVHDDDLSWAKVSMDGDPLKTKYPYVCHAEVNAILNRNHASAPGQRIYVTMFPCNECAKLIIQAGIQEVVYFTDKGDSVAEKAKTAGSFSYMASKRLLAMADLKVRQHKPARRRIVLEFV